MITPVSVYLIAGFLGSGKTTLLKRIVAEFAASSRKAAVVLNEIGEMNVEGQDLGGMPLTELLGGCVCCSAGSDLTSTILQLCQDYKPEAIFVETTGIADPMEILGSITEASMKAKAVFQGVVTVVDGPYLLKMQREGGTSQTFRLMERQIQSADWLILNKSDMIPSSDIQEVRELLRSWNPHASVQQAVRCQVSLEFLEAMKEVRGTKAHHADETVERESHHHVHSHIRVYTHYFNGSINRNAFVEFMRDLPEEVVRAKGILQFTDRNGPMQFQYSHRVLEMVRVTTGDNEPNVAIFIGEHLPGDKLAASCNSLQEE